MILKSHFILYVDDQRKSADFYAVVLNKSPRLDVPGMTEFELAGDAILGLMPKTSLPRLFGNQLAGSELPAGLLRAEIYLLVDNPAEYHQRALGAGAQNLSDLARRDWGDVAAYCFDPDGHVLAFASEFSSGLPGEAGAS